MDQHDEGYDGTHNRMEPESDPEDEHCLGCTLGIVAMIGLVVFVAGRSDKAVVASAAIAAGTARKIADASVSHGSAIAGHERQPAFDPARFLVNALLASVLETDADPMRWANPVATSLCGPDTKVSVNGAPLVAGALVPAAPFTMDWQADSCRPFGAQGPRFDGNASLSVNTEEWGYSALVEPSSLRMTMPDHASVAIDRGWAFMPSVGDGEPDVVAHVE